MTPAGRPQVYSIAAHRGFADALVAGLVPRYSEEGFGLARLTLLLPSSRAARTVTEAFIRHSGETGSPGLLLPRMVMVGDLDLDESLGPLFDSLGAGAAIPSAASPTRRWLRLAQLIGEEMGKDAPRGSASLRLAFEMGRAFDRLLAEEIAPESLLSEAVLDLTGDLAEHWQRSLRLFARVQIRWLAEMEARGECDQASRRNLLFREAARQIKANPPETPFVAAGVTSAAPALAALLRQVSELQAGAVILPDLDLSMRGEVWDELGNAGAPDAEQPFSRTDAVTHPQYHLKLLLNRMGVARDEVQPWHRAGLGKGPPERSHAISSLFLPPMASRAWVNLPAKSRRLAGVRLMESANAEGEAQGVALLVREALEQPEKRVAVLTPDRELAGRIVQHLRRWNIAADDTGGRPLPQTPAGRLFLLLAELGAESAAPVPLMALLSHPLVRAGEGRNAWLDNARALELRLRGPRPRPGLAPLSEIAVKAKVSSWWEEVAAILAPLCETADGALLSDRLDALVAAGEALCGEALWAREDGRALAAFVEDLRLTAGEVGTVLDAEDLPVSLREAMEQIAVRAPWGGHPRVAIYGLLEGRMTRADLVICAGLNEGTWPPASGGEALLAPSVLRVLGVPGADFRIGLSAHDLAGALGAPEVVLSRARRDSGGPAIPSRFLLRVRALLGADLIDDYIDERTPRLAEAMGDAAPAQDYIQPDPMPSPQQRLVSLSVTALDRLRSDPYQFYAARILRLPELEPLDAEPSPAWQGSLAHKILEDWHNGKGELAVLAEQHLQAMGAHPLMRALWKPRLLAALEWVATEIEADPSRKPILSETDGQMQHRGVTIRGKADRIDRLADGSLAIVDYKTGGPPSGAEVEAGFALQLGTLGLMAQAGAFGALAGEPEVFEYWSLGKNTGSKTEFGYKTTPLKVDRKRTGIEPENFLPETARFLDDALDRWILGTEGFTARLNPDAKVYSTYDQLMRLQEWLGREKFA